MRRIKYSHSFYEEFATLLEQGVDRFGPTVVAAKRKAVLDTIERVLVRHPKRSIDPDIKVCAYQVRKTPFIVLYNYDDTELRIYLIIHASSDRALVDLSKVIW